MRTNTCPQARAWALAMAALRNWSSLPSARVRQGPEDSLNASPNLACGTVFTTASYMSSAVLMKCVWPRMMLVSSGNFIRTDSSSSINLLPTANTNIGAQRPARSLGLVLYCARTHSGCDRAHLSYCKFGYPGFNQIREVIPSEPHQLPVGARIECDLFIAGQALVGKYGHAVKVSEG